MEWTCRCNCFFYNFWGCIHFPYKNHGKVPTWHLFCLKRILRLFIPFIAVLLLEKIIKLDGVRVGLNLWYSIVGWSLTCELLYYLSYPLLFNISKRISWVQIFVISFFTSMLIVLSNHKMMHYPSFGTIGNMILGLPCWILGVLLADRYSFIKSRKINLIKLNSIRFSILCASTFCYGLFLYFEVGFPLTLNFFAIAVFFWLSNELSQNNFKTNRFLEWGGKWSYSVI